MPAIDKVMGANVFDCFRKNGCFGSALVATLWTFEYSTNLFEYRSIQIPVAKRAFNLMIITIMIIITIHYPKGK